MNLQGQANAQEQLPAEETEENFEEREPNPLTRESQEDQAKLDELKTEESNIAEEEKINLESVQKEQTEEVVEAEESKEKAEEASINKAETKEVEAEGEEEKEWENIDEKDKAELDEEDGKEYAHPVNLISNFRKATKSVEGRTRKI